MTNPLLAAWETTFALPPFDAIEEEHFPPAFDAALEEARAAWEAIATDPAAPDFTNTIEAMERAEETLDRVSAVFFNRLSTDSTEGLRAQARALSPRLAEFHADVMTDPRLFARVEALWRDRDALDLSPEQARVLELTRRAFVRSGARLDEAGRARLREILSRLASLGTAFGQAVQKDEEDWTLPLAPEDLDGLPADLQSGLAAAAAERGKEGHVLTLSRSLVEPFLAESPRRDLRETAWRAWTSRGAMRPETGTGPLIAEILALREERARLLGYPDFATFKLEPQMAGTPDRVRALLEEVWTPARAQAEADAGRLEALMHGDGVNDRLRPWDWRYYAERQRRAEHDLDASEVKPYLALERIREAAFDVAGRLFGLEFRPLDAALHHADARAWEVRRGARHMGVFVADYFARGPKRSGAWCSRFRAQSGLDGEVRPIVLNVCNFARPAAGQPALLTFDDARTLFHEFGHALHSLLSDVTYPSVSGTSVARDFVELPSQLYEHWLSTPEVLTAHARHVESGAPMPAGLRDRLLAAERFGQGFATVEYVASALIDLDLHTGSAPADPAAAEAATLSAIGMPEAIAPRHAAPHFLHVFSGDGYSAGYYSYLWSELMDADAFAAFEEAGDPFDPETAAALARHIYSAGGSAEPEALYTAFRGRMPDSGPLLRRRGLAA